ATCRRGRLTGSAPLRRSWGRRGRWATKASGTPSIAWYCQTIAPWLDALRPCEPWSTRVQEGTWPPTGARDLRSALVPPASASEAGNGRRFAAVGKQMHVSGLRG